MSRQKLTVDSDTRFNAGARSGVYSVENHPDDDSIIGNLSFIPLWVGVRESGNILEAYPSPSGLIGSFYFGDLLPYNWS
jgi:hypothetical protein